MSAVAIMASEKKSNKKPPAGNPDEGEKKNVKVSLAFHKRLKQVAAELDIEMGALVERELEEFLSREWAALVKRSEP